MMAATMAAAGVGGVAAETAAVEYRPMKPVLDEAKISLSGQLAAQQEEFERQARGQEHYLDSTLSAQSGALRTTLHTHRAGFDRPSAVLAMYEKRTEEQEKMYQTWQSANTKYQEEQRRFKMQYPASHADAISIVTVNSRAQKIKALQEMKGECKELKTKLVTDAANMMEYGENLRMSTEEMNKRQKVLYKELREHQGEIAGDAARQRAQSAELRMRGVTQMQQQQKALRNHMQLEKEHRNLRLVNIMSRSEEQKRALSLGTPAWLLNITPRPWST